MTTGTAGSSGEQAEPGPDGIMDETREELPGLRDGEGQGSAEGGQGVLRHIKRGKRERLGVLLFRQGIRVFFFADVSSKGLAWASRRQAAGRHVHFG